MKIEDYILYIINIFVNNEIESLEEELISTNDIEEKENTQKYIDYLSNLNWEDLNNILKDIQENSNFMDILFDTLIQYVYKYKTDKGAKNE